MESNFRYAIFISLTFSRFVLNHGVLAESIKPDEAKQLRDEVLGMFYHAFDGYMNNAKEKDALGGYALTLIDSLDTLALHGDQRALHFFC